MKPLTCFLVIFSTFCLLDLSIALAGPKGEVKSLAKRYRNIDRKVNRILRRFQKLTPSQQISLLSRLENRYSDVDNDKLPDLLDPGAGLCNSDVDDDGILDGEDREDDSSSSPSPSATPSASPSPSASQSPTQNEIEIHALIQEINQDSITVNSSTFLLNNTTEYLDGENNPISRLSFSIGECVEVEGYSNGRNLIAEKIKMDDDC